MPHTPWTLHAFATYLRHGSQVPEYTLQHLRDHGPAPEDAIFWNVSTERWETLRDIQNPSLARHIQTYAKEHGGKAIPRDVLLTWEREWGRQKVAQELHALVEQVIEQQRAKDTRDRQGAINALIAELESI